MNLLLDTNAYRHFCEGDTQALAAIQRAASIYLPFIVLAELRGGFMLGTKGHHNEGCLSRFLNNERVVLLFADSDTTKHYAAVYAQLRRQGTPIPTNDIWIAALAIQHDLILFTYDTHFANLPQLPTLRHEDIK